MANPETNKQVILKYLEAKGFPDNAIPAIMANIEVETGGTFDYKTKQRGGSAKGLFQFDPKGGKYQDYKSYLGDYKDNMFQQIDYFYDTILGDRQHVIGTKNARKLQQSFENDDPRTIAENLTNIWFRPGKPHLEKRLNAVDNYIPQQPQTQPQGSMVSNNEMFGTIDYLRNLFNFGK